MSMMNWLSLVMLLSMLSRSVAAQTPNATTELAVNGPQGALLIMDEQALGKLPLPVNPVVPAGPHRFRLELGSQNAESDTLTLPALGQAELNLTLSGSTLVAVLRIADGLLLVLQPPTIPSAVRDNVSAAVATAAKQEHSILLGSDKQAALLHGQSSLIRCIENGDCHEALFRDGQVTYVLSLRVDDVSTGGSCILHAALLDTRTRDLSASAEEGCVSSDASALSTQIGVLTAKLLQETATRPRGGMAVTSTPDGAKVLVDGRWLGVTPFQQETFAGSRVIEVQYDRYLPHKETVQIEPNQTTTVKALLQLAPSAPLARPLWRIITGSLLIGGGILLVGFGASALLTDGQCKNGSTNFDTCNPYYGTAPIGGGLVGAGAALAIGGTIMLAIPRRVGAR